MTIEVSSKDNWFRKTHKVVSILTLYCINLYLQLLSIVDGRKFEGMPDAVCPTCEFIVDKHLCIVVAGANSEYTGRLHLGQRTDIDYRTALLSHLTHRAQGRIHHYTVGTKENRGKGF
jgi:hypothetical protein